MTTASREGEGASPPSTNELVITRVLDAPREVVFFDDSATFVGRLVALSARTH